MTQTAAAQPATGLWRYASFAAVLSAAGLPIYIHAPKFYVDSYGVTLAQLTLVLFLLRVIDMVQDPLLARLADVTRDRRGLMVAAAGLLMAVGMALLFAVAPPFAPVLWFALSLALLFSAFSFLTICFYAQGVARAEALGDGHLRLASWRETGALLGICVAAALPTVLAGSGAPFALYAVIFAGVTGIALTVMASEWSGRGAAPDGGLRRVVADPIARRLLLIALVNATPVAVTSTLFLFFVSDRLEAPGLEGPFLLLFFLSAAGAAPVWGRIADRIGAKRALIWAMGLAIVTFAFALMLGPGDRLAFAAICVASGAAVGADLTLLPALFARRMARIAPSAADGFGLWSFVNKATLAVAAIALFPILEASGFQSGEQNDAPALWSLTVLYAGVPLLLKALALALMTTLDTEDAP